jgi:hypothetical protein
MKKADTISWLELPERDPCRYMGNSLLYGAGKVAGAYAGLRHIPEKIKGEWMHGWNPDFVCRIDVDLPFGVSVQQDEVRYVATEYQEKFFAENSLPAKAIGMPIAYLQPKTYQRRPGTLLVMPVHSETASTHKWKFRQYAEEIASLKSQFKEVVACVHTSCITNGYWVNEFREIGVPVIEGAHGNDRNSLERIRALASQFEFITTNGFGSHIAYFSAYGAKVSIHGGFCSYTEEDFPDHALFSSKPGLLKRLAHSLSEECVRAHLGEFFVHPLKAIQRLEWGLKEIGYHNRISPAELRRCFGWSRYQEPLDRARKKATLYFQIASNRLLTRRMRDALQEWQEPALKARNTELRRLEALPNNQHGTALLDGEAFHFLQAKDFVDEYRRVFQQHACGFLCAKVAPVIVDWGAGIGIPARFWARDYPGSKIHTYAATSQDKDCLLQNVALAHGAEIVVHEREEELTGLLGEEIDFLRINLGEQSIACFAAVGERLSNVKRCLIVCQTPVDKSQSLASVLSLMEKRGFRYHIEAIHAARNPLLSLPISSNVDCRLNIWGYQGKKFPMTLPEDLH